MKRLNKKWRITYFKSLRARYYQCIQITESIYILLLILTVTLIEGS